MGIGPLSQRVILRLNGGIESFHHRVALSPWASQLAFLSHCIWSVKWIRLDDLQNPLKLERSMILLPWDLIGFGMGCCKGWRQGKSDAALMPCWFLLPSQGSLFDVGLLSGYVCALSRVCLAIAPVPILFLMVWERASRWGDSQAGFLPKSSLDGETHKVQRDFLFCFPQAQATLDYKTHTQKQKHIHKQNRMFSLLSLLESKQSLTIWVTFIHGPRFHHYGSK